MSEGYRTDQEEFWAGQFGDEYIDRNQSDRLLASNRAFFARILRRTQEVESVLEFGANIGLNLRALRALLPRVSVAGVEINARAVEELRKLPEADVFHESILQFEPSRAYDFVLTKTVLIHIAPEELEVAYQAIYHSSRRYICMAEYYNPTPVEVAYRGHAGKLFKRDWAGDMLERFRSLRLVDYGFVYHGDEVFPQDDITWFLLEKTSR